MQKGQKEGKTDFLIDGFPRNWDNVHAPAKLAQIRYGHLLEEVPFLDQRQIQLLKSDTKDFHKVQSFAFRGYC